MSSLALNFNGVELQTTNHENQTWMTSTELAKALGYSRADMVSKIYDRNKDEFSEKMSKIIDPQNGVLGESSGLQHKSRIFSLRGCHMIAMFSKTQIAKLFRVWVLDVLDKEVSKPVEKPLPTFKPQPMTTPLHPTMMTRQMKTHVQHMIDLSIRETNVTSNKVSLDLAAFFYCDSWDLIPMAYYPDVCAYFDVEPLYQVESTNRWIMVDAAALGKLIAPAHAENADLAARLAQAEEDRDYFKRIAMASEDKYWQHQGDSVSKVQMKKSLDAGLNKIFDAVDILTRYKGMKIE